MLRLLLVVVSRSTVTTAEPPFSETVISPIVTGLSAGELVGIGVKVGVDPPPLPPLAGVGVLVGLGVDVAVAGTLVGWAGGKVAAVVAGGSGVAVGAKVGVGTGVPGVGVAKIGKVAVAVGSLLVVGPLPPSSGTGVLVGGAGVLVGVDVGIGVADGSGVMVGDGVDVKMVGVGVGVVRAGGGSAVGSSAITVATLPDDASANSSCRSVISSSPAISMVREVSTKTMPPPSNRSESMMTSMTSSSKLA